MKSFGIAIFGWLVPGGAYLVTRRYVQFALALAMVAGATVAGVALHGTNLWPSPAELEGLDGLTGMLAKGGAMVRMLAGVPYLLARLAHYSQSFLGGQTHEYGGVLLAMAGAINMLALADGLERRKAERA